MRSIGKTLLAVVLIALCHTALSDDDAQLQSIMQELRESLLTLLPIVRGESFEPATFEKEAARMKHLFDQAGDHFDDQPIGSQITYEMFRDRLNQVSHYAEADSLFTAKAVLAESFELCASCHTQDQKSRRAFGISRIKQLDEFLAAEYSYLSRDYDSALTSYKNFLSAEKSDVYKRTQALDRILAITMEVHEDATGARDMLTALGDSLISDTEKLRVKDWIGVLELIAKAPDESGSPLSPGNIDELEHYLHHDWPSVQSFLNWNEQQAYWMLIRARLNAFLRDKPDPAKTPVLLYWLAVSDRSTHYQFYESLSRRYLEQCIRQYPDHPYAKECFDEFELLMIVSFSGSGGINIPFEVRQEINELRKIVYGN